MLKKNPLKHTLLYIDTNHEFSQILSRLLEREAYRVIFYSHHPLETSFSFAQNIDLCLCEFKLFKKAMLTRNINDSFLNALPIIVLANHFSDQDKKYVTQSTAVGFFEKSEPFIKILHKIKTALQDTSI